jgi:hypothetical protein
MSTSEKTLEQVKSILGRLDRCIDAAREKRLHGSAPTPVPAAPVQPIRDANQPQIGTSETPTPAPSNGTTSKFGRAQPLRLDDRPRF